MIGEKKSILNYLMEINFALVETDLYIDKNPSDDNALSLHNILVEKYKNLQCTYESKFGPLKSLESPRQLFK